MEQALFLVLGAVLTLAGSYVLFKLQSGAAKEQWELERDERRLDRAATDLARVKVFVEEYSPDNMVLHFNPKDPFTLGNERVDQWRAIRPDITWIGLVYHDLAEDVDALVEEVLNMSSLTGESIRGVARQMQTTTQIQGDALTQANEAKERARSLMVSISARLNG
jgi:hypothetical protein